MKKVVLIAALVLAGAAHADESTASMAKTVKLTMQIEIGKCSLIRSDTGFKSPEFKDCIKTNQNKFKELYVAFEPNVKKPAAKAALKTMFVKCIAALTGLNALSSESWDGYYNRQSELDNQIEEAWASLNLEL